ncbi:adenylate/guanylate cyclase domain-containing protein [Rhizobium leguminosarum]
MNARRSIEGRPTTDVYVGLHVGELFYGNIGSAARLDFTVVGRTVNEASRIVGLCHALSTDILMSSIFAQSLDATKRTLAASVGCHSLRGVSKSMELYSLKNQAQLSAAFSDRGACHVVASEVPGLQSRI